MAISSSEAHYIIESCLNNFRIDGRSQLEHRPYTITNRSSSTNKKITNPAAPALILSNGSSRIHLPGSTTDILCSVKADLVHPSPSKPNEGVVELHIDLALCGGGGTISSGGASSGSGARRRQQREEESQITSLLQRLVLPHAVNYNKLVVWPGRYVWRLAIDIVVLRCDGCVLDGASIALREALGNTKLPRVQAVMESNNDEVSNNNGGSGGGGGGSSSKNDLMVDGDINKAMSPPGAEDCPLVVTVSVLSAPPSSKSLVGSKRHRSISIIDARTEEEACASSRVCVSVDPSGLVCGVHTLGGGGVVLEEEVENGGGGSSSSMPLAILGDVVTSAAMAAKSLYELLEDDDGGDGKREVNGLRKNNVVAVTEDDGCGYGNLLKNHFLIQ